MKNNIEEIPKRKRFYFFRILINQFFRENIIFNITLTILIFLPEIINILYNNYNTYILNIPNKYIEIDFDYSLLKGAFIAILTSMNINESYSKFCKTKKWNKYFLNETKTIYLNNLISLNNILRYNYFYVPSLWTENLTKISNENDILIIENQRKKLDNSYLINQLKVQYKKYITELEEILLTAPIDNQYDHILLNKFYNKFINQKKFIIIFKNSISSKVKNEKELISLLKLTHFIDEFEENFLNKSFITDNLIEKLNLEINYLKALINIKIE